MRNHRPTQALGKIDNQSLLNEDNTTYIIIGDDGLKFSVGTTGPPAFVSTPGGRVD